MRRSLTRACSGRRCAPPLNRQVVSWRGIDVKTRREPDTSPSKVIIILLLSGALTGTARAADVAFDGAFHRAQRLCDEYFLPNSMARPAGFDREARLRRLESQLRERASVFRSPRGVEYLRSHLGKESDDISRACAQKLLAYAQARPANTRLQRPAAAGDAEAGEPK